MERKNQIQILIWSFAFIVWAIWVKGRIDISEGFVGNYKGVGYFVATNDHYLIWYIITSFVKVALVLTILYYIIPKYGFQKIAIFHTLIWAVVLMTLEWLIAKGYFLLTQPKSGTSYRLDWHYDFPNNLIIYFIYTLASWVVSAAYHWLVGYNDLKKLHQDQQSYYKLKEQLNPHFIFNSLNGLYEIALTEGSQRIESGILNLTKTLRYTIDYSHQAKVPLNKEMEAIESYIELQKTRFEKDELLLFTSFNINDGSLLITPLILLNYVENAFKHGYKYGKNCEISIDIEESRGKLVLIVKNTNHSLRVNKNGGNKHIDSILKLNYPNKHSIQAITQNDFYTLKLWIQLG